MDDIYKNIEECNPNKKRKILIVLDDMIADMLSNKKLNPILPELFIRRIKHFSCFYYTILFYCTKKYWAKFYMLFYYENSKQTRTSTNWKLFLVIDATLASDNLLRFRENLSERI